LVLKNQT